MIVKERPIPVEIIVNEALKGRLPANHPIHSAIEKDLYKRYAGLYGEEAVDYPLKLLSQKDYAIFHGLRLAYEDMHFQIDTLLLTRRFAAIIEAKNLGGELFFDVASEQLFQTYNGTKEGLQYPIPQVKRQAKLLRAILYSQKIPDIPIESLIVIAHSSTILSPLGSPVFRIVCHAHALHGRIEKIENRYKKEILDLKSWQKAIRFLIKKHEPYRVNIKKKYGIDENELLTGVHCPNCSFRPMLYENGKWLCSACKKVSKDAHIQALRDYYYLVDTTITNSKIRWFLHISSHNSGHKMLLSLNLPATGHTRSRFYNLQPILSKK